MARDPLKQKLAARKQQLQLAENETAALQQENAALKAANTEQAATLADRRATIVAVSPLDQRTMAIFNGDHNLVLEKQAVVETRVLRFLEKFRKAKLYWVEKDPI